MAYLDLKTGEIYGHLIYQDDQTVILAASWGESAISAAEWAEGITILEAETENRARYREADRFQAMGPFAGPPRQVQERIDQLAAYAAGNGGQVAVHQAEPDRGAVRRLFDLFKPS